MPDTREFFDDVGPDDRIRYRFAWDHGEIVDFLLQHETMIGEQYAPVVRYDTYYDKPHKDVLAPDGSIAEKEWLPDQWDTKECFDHPAADLRNHWDVYKRRFMERYG